MKSSFIRQGTSASAIVKKHRLLIALCPNLPPNTMCTEEFIELYDIEGMTFDEILERVAQIKQFEPVPLAPPKSDGLARWDSSLGGENLRAFYYEIRQRLEASHNIGAVGETQVQFARMAATIGQVLNAQAQHRPLCEHSNFSENNYVLCNHPAFSVTLDGMTLDEIIAFYPIAVELHPFAAGLHLHNDPASNYR